MHRLIGIEECNSSMLINYLRVIKYELGGVLLKIDCDKKIVYLLDWEGIQFTAG